MISWYHLDLSGTRAPNLVCSLTGAHGEVYLPVGQGQAQPLLRLSSRISRVANADGCAPDLHQLCPALYALLRRLFPITDLLDYSRDWHSWQISPFELSNVCQWFAFKVFQNTLRRTCRQERRIRLFSDFLPHLAFETI